MFSVIYKTKGIAVCQSCVDKTVIAFALEIKKVAVVVLSRIGKWTQVRKSVCQKKVQLYNRLNL
jgi:hypothetical protein